MSCSESACCTDCSQQVVTLHGPRRFECFFSFWTSEGSLLGRRLSKRRELLYEGRRSAPGDAGVSFLPEQSPRMFVETLLEVVAKFQHVSLFRNQLARVNVKKLVFGFSPAFHVSLESPNKTWPKVRVQMQVFVLACSGSASCFFCS